MKVIKIADVPKTDMTNQPIFFGGKISRQPLVDEKSSKFFNFSVVNFAKGARNKWHVHSSDQILLVTQGKGIVATEKEERTVTEGTVIHVIAGEKHWHGASKDSEFSHITLTAVGSSTEMVA
jgi:quercetin dioxygenase-like cupin family protein